MKILILILSSALSLSLNAQTFMLQTDKGLNDFNLCQENHNIILRKFSNLAEDQSVRLLNGILIEEDSAADLSKIEKLKNLLAQNILKTSIFKQLRQQLNKEGLNTRLIKNRSHPIPVLSTENMGIEIESTLLEGLTGLVKKGKISINEYTYQRLKKDLNRQLVAYYVYKEGVGFASSLITGFFALQSGKIILKSFSLSVGIGALSSGAISLGLNLISIPLMGHRPPAEDLWVEMLKKYPTLIMIPDLMNKVGINDPAWSTHCYAIQRRTTSLENALKKALALEEKQFLTKINHIYNSLDENSNIETDNTDPYFQVIEPMVSDNTRMVHPILQQNTELVPSWALPRE